MGWTKRRRGWTTTKELLVLPLLPCLLMAATAKAYEIEESSSSESTEEYEQTDSYPPVEQGRSGISDVCEEEVQKWMCIDLVNSDSAMVSGPRVTDFPTVPDVKYEKLSQTISRVTHVYSEGYELMVPPNATIQVTCSQVKVQSPTFNCSHDYLMINSARFCNNNFPQAPFTFTSGNPGSQESMIVLKTANPQRAAYSCQLQVVRRYPKRVIDLIKHVEFTLDVGGSAYRQETDFVILAPKKSFVVMSCPVFEVSDYWPCKQSYVTIELQRYCHFPTAHKVEIEIPPTGTASIAVKLASSPNDRVQCVLHRIAGKKTACVESPNTPTYVGAPEQRAQICINMVASPIVKIVSPFRDEMETEMDMTVRYEVMSVPHMVHYLWCSDFRLDTDCSKERLHWFNYNDRLCGHSRPRDFTYSYGSVVDKATYSLTYRKQRGVRQGHFSCFLYREPQTKGTYTLDLFSKNSATIEKHPSKRIFPHDSQVITYYVLAPPDSEVIVTCSAFNIQSGQDCSQSYLKINDRQYCDSNVPGRQRLELTYNYATITFRDGKDASNSFKCTFERGSSTDKCAFEKKPPSTTMPPWETISTTVSAVTEYPSFPEEGVTTVPSGTTLITPFTEETVPWYTAGSSTPHTLKHTPSFTPEEGETFSETPFPEVSTENPEEVSLFPQQQGTRPSLPGASISATTEVELPPEAASPSTGLVPAISQTVSPAEFPSAPSVPQHEPSYTLPPEVSAFPTTQVSSPQGASHTPNTALPSRPAGVSVPETFPPGISVFPTSEMPLPSGVPSEEGAIVPTISIAATEPETVTGAPTSTAEEVTATPPYGVSVGPTTEISLPTGVSGRPSFVPSATVGVSLPETLTPFLPIETQKGIPATLPSPVSFMPTSSVSHPSSMFSEPATWVPPFTGGPLVPGTMIVSPPSVTPVNASSSFRPGMSLAPTTEVSFPSGATGEPSLIVPSVSLGVSVPELTPSTAQKESTATMPSGMHFVPTSEASIPSFTPGIPTALSPNLPVGISAPSIPTTEMPLSGIPGEPTAVPSLPQTEPGSSQSLPHGEFTTPVPSGPSGVPTTEVSMPSGIQSQPTAVVPSVSVAVSVPGTGPGSVPSFPHEGLSTPFPSGPSGIPTTEVPPLSGIPGQPTAIVPSVSQGVSLPWTEPGSSQTLPHGEFTTPVPSGPSGVPTTEVSMPSGIQSQPTAVVPSVSVAVSVPGTGPGSVPSFPHEGLSTPFPSGPSGIPTTQVPPLSGIPGQPTAIVPSVSQGVSLPWTEPGSSQTLPNGEFTTPLPSGPSGVATTEISMPSGIQSQPTAVVPSVTVAVSLPETGPGNVPFFPHKELSTPFPSGPSGIPTTELPLSGIPGLPAAVPSVTGSVSVPQTEPGSSQTLPYGEFTTPVPSGPSGVPTTEVSIPSGIQSQPTAVVPSVSVAISLPETGPGSVPSFPHETLSTPLPSAPSGIPTTEVPPLSGIPGQPTAIVPSVTGGVSVPQTEPSGSQTLPHADFGTPVPSGPSGVPTTEVSLPSGVQSQPTAVVPSVSVAVSVPETETSGVPSVPKELSTQFPSAPSGITSTEVPPLSGAPGQPIAIVPSVTGAVSVPQTEPGSSQSLPHGEFTTPVPSGPSGVPTTEVSIPSGIQSQPTAVVPSVSVAVSVPGTETGSAPSFPHEGISTPFPSGASSEPTTHVSPLSGVPSQPTGIIPSVSEGVSVPWTEHGSSQTFPHGGSQTPPPSGPFVVPTTEVSISSAVQTQPTAIVPSVSVGVSVPSVSEGVSVPLTEPGSSQTLPQGELPTSLPSGPSGLPATEVPPSGIPSHSTVMVPSVSLSVSEPATEPGGPETLPHGELTTPFPSGPSGTGPTGISVPSGGQGQTTPIVPSLSMGVSVPETSSVPTFPHGELTPFPSGPSGTRTTEPRVPGVPGQPSAIVPTVSVSVTESEVEGTGSSFPQGELTTPFPAAPASVPTEIPVPFGVPGQPTSVSASLPETSTVSPGSFPISEFTAPFPSGSFIPTTEISIPSGVSGQPTAVVPSVSVGVSVPESQTSGQPSMPHGEITTPLPTGPSGIPVTQVPVPSVVPGESTAVVPSVSLGVSVPESQTSSPPSFPFSESTTPFSTGPTSIPTTELPMQSGVSGEPTAVVPSMSVSVSEPGTQTGSPSFPHEDLTTQFSPSASAVPITETMPSGVPGQPTATIPSVSVAVSVPESQTSSPPSFPISEYPTSLPSTPLVVATTEKTMPSGVPSQPTAVVPVVSVAVSVPESQTSSPPSFPHTEFPFLPNISGVPPGGPSEPTGLIPSVSQGVSMPESQTSSPPSFPPSEFTSLPLAPSVVPTTEKTMPSGVTGQPPVLAPSLPAGISVPESQTSSPPSFPYSEFTTPFRPGFSGAPTEVPIIPGGPGEPTDVIPFAPVGVSVPEGSQSSNPPSFPLSEFTTQLPSAPSVIPTTEKTVPSGVQGQPTALVPSVSVGVSVPELQTSSTSPVPHSEFTTIFPTGPSGEPTEVSVPPGIPGEPTTVVPSVIANSFPSIPSVIPTSELPVKSGVPGQPTVTIPSVSVNVSLPEIGTSKSSLPNGELTTTLPPGFSVLPTTEVSLPSGLPGLPTMVVPSISPGVSGPQGETTGSRFSTPTFPPGESNVLTPQVSPSGTPSQPVFPPSFPSFPSTKVSLPSGASTLAPAVSLGASVPEGVTQPTFPGEEVSGTGVPLPTTQFFEAPSVSSFQPTVSVPSMSAAVSVPQTPPSSPPPPGMTGTFPSAMSVVPTSEVSLPRGVPGEPTAIIPSSTEGVFLPGSSNPSWFIKSEQIGSTFPSGGSVAPTTEVSLPSGVTGLPSVEVPSFTVAVSEPEEPISTAAPLTVETRTLPSGSIASETMPESPAPLPSTFPHGTPGLLTTPPSVPFGPSSVPSGAQYTPTPPSVPFGPSSFASGTSPTPFGEINVQTETGTLAPSAELHETSQTPIPSSEFTTNVAFPSGVPHSPVVAVSEATVGVSPPSEFVPNVATLTTPSFHGTKVANTFTSTQGPRETAAVMGPEEPISTTLPPSLITPETEEIRILLMIIRTDLKTFKVNATVLHTFLIKATTIGSHDAFTIILLALKDLKASCKYLAPSERIKVAYEVAHYLKSHGTRIAHDVVVKAVGVFLCAVDHKDIITKLLSENTYMISISESVASELSCPDMEHLIHLLYADRNRTKIEESPCAGILCEEVPENVMDTIDMLVDRYFPQKAHEKKWLMLDIAKALNLQPEEDEEGDEMVYYKMGDYDVFLEELREPTISDEEKALLFGKFFAEVRKVAKAERKLRLDDLEEVWKMGGGKLPQPAVRSFIALLKLVHSKRISLKTEERIRLLKLALQCDNHECTKLSSSDIHNLIFALCNVGIRDGFGLPKDLKSQVTKFILTLKDNYIDSISIRRWKRSSSLLKPRSHDYLSASSPSELRYLKDWLQKPMVLSQNKGLLKNTGRSNDPPSGGKGSVLSQLYNAYVNEKRPDIKTVLAERLLDTYNDSFKHLGPEVEDTEKFVLSVVQQLPSTYSRHNGLVLGILEQCIRRGNPCLNISSSESIAPLKVILQNMSLKQSPNFVPTLSHDLFSAAKKARTHVDLSWLTNSGAGSKTSQTRVPHVLQVPSRASTLS